MTDALEAWNRKPEHDDAPCDTMWDTYKDAWLDGYETGAERVRVLTGHRDECERQLQEWIAKCTVAEARVDRLTEAARAVIDALTDADKQMLSRAAFYALNELERGVLDDHPPEKVWTVGGVEVLDYPGPEEFPAVPSEETPQP